MRTGDGFLLVYSIIDEKTFENIGDLREKILRGKDRDDVSWIKNGIVLNDTCVSWLSNYDHLVHTTVDEHEMRVPRILEHYWVILPHYFRYPQGICKTTMLIMGKPIV